MTRRAVLLSRRSEARHGGRARAARLALGTPESELALPVKPPEAIRGGAFAAGLMRNLVIPLANRHGK